MVNEETIQDLIKLQETELFARIIKGFNLVNTFKKC